MSIRSKTCAFLAASVAVLSVTALTSSPAAADTKQQECEAAAARYASEYSAQEYTKRYNAMSSVCEDGDNAPPVPGISPGSLFTWLSGYCEYGDCFDVTVMPSY